MIHVEPTLNSAITPARSRRDRVSAAAQQVSDALVLRVPDAMHATEAGGRSLMGALRFLPDRTLRRFAALSVVLGAGFYLAHAPRRVVAAWLAPALIMSVAIIGRPATPAVAS